MAATPLNGHFADLSFSAIEAEELGLNKVNNVPYGNVYEYVHPVNDF